MNQMFREMKASVEAAWDLRQLIARCGRSRKGGEVSSFLGSRSQSRALRWLLGISFQSPKPCNCMALDQGVHPRSTPRVLVPDFLATRYDKNDFLRLCRSRDVILRAMALAKDPVQALQRCLLPKSHVAKPRQKQFVGDERFCSRVLALLCCASGGQRRVAVVRRSSRDAREAIRQCLRENRTMPVLQALPEDMNIDDPK